MIELLRRAINKIVARRSVDNRPLIRVMADYQAFPLWGDAGPADPAELGLSNDLIDALTAWGTTYTRTLNQEDPRKSDFSSPAAAEEFVETGKMIAQAVARELGPAYRVTYFDDSEGREVEVSSRVPLAPCS